MSSGVPPGHGGETALDGGGDGGPASFGFSLSELEIHLETSVSTLKSLESLPPPLSTEVQEAIEGLRQTVRELEPLVCEMKKAELLQQIEAQTSAENPTSSSSGLFGQHGTPQMQEEGGAAHEQLPSTLRGSGSRTAPSTSCSSSSSSSAWVREGVAVLFSCRLLNGSLEWRVGCVERVVMREEEGDGVSVSVPSEALVLFGCPVKMAEIPCRHVKRQEECRFSDRCKFSHGEWVSVRYLRPFAWNPTDDLKVGQEVWVRPEGLGARVSDELWQEGVVEKVQVELPGEGEGGSRAEAEVIDLEGGGESWRFRQQRGMGGGASAFDRNMWFVRTEGREGAARVVEVRELSCIVPKKENKEGGEEERIEIEDEEEEERGLVDHREESDMEMDEEEEEQSGEGVGVRYVEAASGDGGREGDNESGDEEEEGGRQWESEGQKARREREEAGVSAAFCRWDRYTKGYGRRILEKMGYQMGRPLGPVGRRTDGSDGFSLIEPIPIKILPQGRSLDYISENPAINPDKHKRGKRGSGKRKHEYVNAVTGEVERLVKDGRGGNGSGSASASGSFCGWMNLGIEGGLAGHDRRREREESAREDEHQKRLASIRSGRNLDAPSSSANDKGECRPQQQQQKRERNSGGGGEGQRLSEDDARKKAFALKSKASALEAEIAGLEANRERHAGRGGVAQLALSYAQQAAEKRAELRRVKEEEAVLLDSAAGLKKKKKLKVF
uniref:Zinc finger CCCH-type with G patch domain-containing protein n=1 Tax=Chromera velia CCMP2878 TaxID=1169474 RepID=A0A0G4IC17_9ALVE|eukprot:Cvel_12892.t1-p1 / transcript=Cvel_12892.t1 / gene=Cvel_12892 / organism=Chromera_velia_CCMP2878 / gene_product=Zinc finger CCCH-type with G patch, putative / transcript_product=Zinc finger CCCH-type with G patch, putative / location=Cvel_scaffold861:36335-41349(+) / protein_length=726 / sequence_SO=supercontig / SO=protein_coding / is_pseudo=false